MSEPPHTKSSSRSPRTKSSPAASTLDVARFTPLERSATLALSDSAAARIAEMIHSGVLAPGDRLPPERELAAQLSLSRGSLREGLRTLELVGLLEAHVGGGRFVSSAAFDDRSPALAAWVQLHHIRDVIAVRRMLEPEALREIPAVQVQEAHREVDGILKAMQQANDEQAYDKATDLHAQFHRALVRYTTNPLLRALLISFIDASAAAQLTIFHTPRAGRHSIDQHTPIVDALARGDVAAAANLIAQHLTPAFTYPIR